MKLIVILEVIGIAIACQHILNCHQCIFKKCRFKLLLSGESECVKSLGQTNGVIGVASSPNHCRFLEGLITVVKEISNDQIQTESTTINQPTFPTTIETSTESTTQPSTAPTYEQPTTVQTTTELATESTTAYSIHDNYTTTNRDIVTFVKTVFTTEQNTVNFDDSTTLQSNDEPTAATTPLYLAGTITNDDLVTALPDETTTMKKIPKPTTELTAVNSVDEQQIDQVTLNSTYIQNKSVADNSRRNNKRVRMRYIKYSNTSFFNAIPKTRFCTSIPTNVEKFAGILCQIEKFKSIVGRDTFPEKEYIYLMLNEASSHPKTCQIIKRRKRCIKKKLMTRGPRGWGATYPRTSILYDALSQTLKRDCSKFARKETNLESLARLLCQLAVSGKRINRKEFSEQAYGYYLLNPALNYGDVCETLFYR